MIVQVSLFLALRAAGPAQLPFSFFASLDLIGLRMVRYFAGSGDGLDFEKYRASQSGKQKAFILLRARGQIYNILISRDF